MKDLFQLVNYNKQNTLATKQVVKHDVHKISWTSTKTSSSCNTLQTPKTFSIYDNINVTCLYQTLLYIRRLLRIIVRKGPEAVCLPICKLHYIKDIIIIKTSYSKTIRDNSIFLFCCTNDKYDVEILHTHWFNWFMECTVSQQPPCFTAN